jgi:hypothetical protein
MKVNKSSVFANKQEVPYTHIENGSPTVCFMFSGAGYTYDKPLLYYSTMLMLENKYDVVQIHYSYGQDKLKYSLTDVAQIILNDINPVITEVLRNQQYQEILFLGKSLGTIPIIEGFMKNDLYLNSKMILLTPLLEYDSIFETLLKCTHLALIVIGEKDKHFKTGKIKALESKNNLQIEKIPDANHSLDIGAFYTIPSIMVLEKVMKRLNSFFKL